MFRRKKDAEELSCGFEVIHVVILISGVYWLILCNNIRKSSASKQKISVGLSTFNFFKLKDCLLYT